MGSNIPKIGTNDIAGCYVGDTEIEKIYLGSDVIYEKSITPTEKTYTWNFNRTYGNPVNTGGVISGFSGLDMFEINNPVITTTDFEMLFDIITGSGGSYQSITNSSDNYDPEVYKAPRVALTSGGNFRFYCSSDQNPTQFDTKLTSNIVYQENVNYRLLMTIRNGIATLDIKDANNTLIDSVSAQSSGIIWNHNMYVGGMYGETNYYFKGIFNSNKSYIKVNGNLISNITENT